MTIFIQQQVLEKAAKIRKNILSDLEEYYGEPSEWVRVSTDLVKYGIFYSNACNQTLKAALLYRYNIKGFTEKYLLPEVNLQIDQVDFQRHHYSLLVQYFVNRILIGILLNDEVDVSKAELASSYHYKSIKEYGYSNESDALTELKSESMLSTFVPKFIINRLLGVDCSDVIECIGSDVESSEKIWVYSWRFVYALFTNRTSELKSYWEDLLNEWKVCFLNANYSGFNNSYFVLFYIFYCDRTNKRFSLDELSLQILRTP